jgi:hypothetical protein
MNVDRSSFLLLRTSLIGCLLGAIATAYFFAGLAGYVGHPLIDITVVIGLLIAVLFALYHFFFFLPQKNSLAGVLWILVLIVLASEIILGLAPPTARDELTHHLIMPRLYGEAGRIVEIPFAPYSYYPMLLDMLYTPWVRWQWDFVPKLVHGLYGLLTGLLIYAYLSRRLSAIYGLLGLFFFLSVPAVMRLSTWAYVDLGVTFYCTASLFCLLRWFEKKESRRWLMLAGASAGFAAATKPNGILVPILLCFLMAWAFAKDPKRDLGSFASRLTLFGVLALLPFLPWLLKNWAQTGNPFFPFAAGWFAARAGGGGAAATAELGILVKRELLYGESWWQIAALPLRVFFFGEDDNPQYFDGVLTPLLILFLPWAFKGKWREEKKYFFGFVLLYFVCALFLADLRIRYILVIVAPLTVLLVYGVHNIYLSIKHPSYLFATLVILSAFNGAYLWRYFQTVAPLEYLAGRESRDAYLTRMLAEYPAFQYINRELPPAAKIYLLFVGRRAYYCLRDYYHDGGELPWFLLGVVRSSTRLADIAVKLNEKSLTHLLVRDDLLDRFLRDNLTARERPVWDTFAAHHLRRLFQARGYSVYQVDG